MLLWTVSLLLSEGIVFPECHGVHHTVKTPAPSLQPVTPHLHLSESHLSVCISSFSLPFLVRFVFPDFFSLSLSFCIFLSTSLSLLILSLYLFFLVSLISASSCLCLSLLFLGP